MTFILDIFAAAIQLGSLALVLYGMVVSLEADVLVDRILRSRAVRGTRALAAA